MAKKIKRRKKQYTAIQPRDGDRVVLCGHMQTGGWHFWQLQDGITMARPDGTMIEPKWLVACDQCFVEYAGKDPLTIPIREDSVWKGNAPHIEEPTKH